MCVSACVRARARECERERVRARPTTNGALQKIEIKMEAGEGLWWVW